ncbi:hypothetical protein EVAR_51688_1 [Eumeta japonica]|uniref:Uncharacterized protein n=1 Tax=Eumeta variegata TaxID=151549 RepID=A0A4C1Y7E5_EUMVA|nr:hypothetical protein EVAR_51688_1 [Eumeta japonica]
MVWGYIQDWEAVVRTVCTKVANTYKSSQGDMRSEPGDREDHIHFRDRVDCAVRFVRFSTGGEAARRAEDA